MAAPDPVAALRDMLYGPAPTESPFDGEEGILPLHVSEGDKPRMRFRISQIDIGKNTLSYQRYRLLVPR